jgi:hypothetical protein
MHSARNELERSKNQAYADWFATPEQFRERLPATSYGLPLSAGSPLGCELILVHPD